jgi:predicted metal-dependent HD superfamily phosphohydrolase
MRRSVTTTRWRAPTSPPKPCRRKASQRNRSNGALLCDADLLILASPPDIYASYVLAIRQEYAHVPEPDFNTGRGQVLRGLLELPQLYRLMPVKVEEAARANLVAELNSYPT